MAAYDLLTRLVSNGSNLILCNAVSYEVLERLAAIAATSGAKLTVTTAMSYEVLERLSATYGNAITFIDGLQRYEKAS